ncbi:MAG: hypothetical protein HY079_05135 [Elusimicrobia bacterium]|nr:hypothetical protein [Elusimicrobiota bacterium]
MKKLLGSTLALAMFLPAGANAELLKNLKVGGQLDVQATSAQNVTDFLSAATNGGGTPAVNPQASGRDHVGSAFTRTMLKVDWDLLDDVHARISVVKGDNKNGTPRPYGGNSQTVQNAALATPLVTEANVKIDKLFGFADTTIGRQYYGNPGDMVVYYGPRDNYGLGVDAIDAFRFDWNGEKVGLTGIAGKIDGANGLGTNVASVDLRGLVANIKANDMASGSAYIYNKETHNTSATGSGAFDGKNDFLWVLGVKGKLATGGLTVNGEIAKNLGQNRAGGTPYVDASYSGWAMLLNAAYKLDLNNVGAITPWGEFGFGSGRSRSNTNHNDGWVDINSDYRPGGIYGRFDSDLGSTPANSIAQAGLSNRTIYGFGVKATPASLAKLTVGAQYYHYAFSRTSTFTTPASIVQFPRSIGTEYDVTAEWKHSENVGLKLTLGSFQPGAYIYAKRQPNAAVSPATLAALDTTIRF